METIKIKASLVRATKSDCFTRDESPRENKLFFVKNHLGEFTGIYRISGTEIYDIQEIMNALNSNSLYMLSNHICESNYCFRLILKCADDFDFFYTTKHLKPNVLYYVRNSPDEVTGPYILNSTNENDCSRIREAIKKHILYIPDSKQTFETSKKA
jgi:hypothetical protein